MHSYLRAFPGAGKEKDDFISSVNSAASSLGEFLGASIWGPAVPCVDGWFVLSRTHTHAHTLTALFCTASIARDAM